MKLNRTFLTVAAFAFCIATTATAQTGNIVTMKTTADSIAIIVEYIGTGTIKANGTTLDSGSVSRGITPAADNSIIITTTGNIQLTYLYVGFNDITQLDISKAIYLEILICYCNQLTELDVSKNTALINLDCYSNQLTELDVTNNTVLWALDCSYNQLTTLDVEKNTALFGLYCQNNRLTTLNVEKNTALLAIEAGGQGIKVPISVGATTFSNPIFYKTSEGEQTVQIDTEWYAYNATVPITAMWFTTNLPMGVEGDAFGGIFMVVTGTGIAERQASTVSIYPNPAQHTLYIESAEEVEQVSVYDISGRMLTSTVIARSTGEERGSTTWQSPTNIDISHLANGIYLVKVKTAAGETVKKIVKQ